MAASPVQSHPGLTLSNLCHWNVTGAWYKAITLCRSGDKSDLGAMNEEHTTKNAKESFVARIWLEQDDSGNATWRGHIRHVQGEEEEYFQGLKEMREFLGRVSGVSGPALTAQPLGSSMNSKSGTVTNINKKD
jgi:hypothetical protein